VLLLYAPFLFLLGAALARRGVVPLRRLAPLGLSLLVSSGIGFVVWAASTYGDGVQFFATSAFPALNLLVLTSLTVMEGRWARVAATVLGIVAIAAWLGAIQRLVRPASHAADYATFIASKQVPRRTMGAFIRNPEELRRSSPFALNLQWNALGGVLGFLPNHVGSVSLNAPVVDGVSQDPLVSLHERRRAFVQALSDVRRSTPGVAEGLVQRRFVEENGLKYLILAPGVELPDSLAPLVTQMHEDSRTGERFCWLRRDE
jgi:hypothetical protein